MNTPFQHRIPTGRLENLRWRRRVHRRVTEDPILIDVLRTACAKDPIFFINGFVWTYDPFEWRSPLPKLPFILYDFQQTALLEILNAISKGHDLFIEKSRDMGASWLCLTAMAWRWLFKPFQSFLFVSRKEEYVDKSGNPKCLFWKLDFLIDNLPLWLQPQKYNKDFHRTKLHIENPNNGSVIDGESTTGQVARGDRRTAIVLDEFAVVEQGDAVLSATRDATPCRIFNSTPEGTNNAFYKMKQTNITKLRLHWPMHPIKSIGLYTKEAEQYIVLDEEYWNGKENQIEKMQELDAKILARRVPLPDGKRRSPWYANECERAGSAQEIAQEVDIDYEGSGRQFFNPDKIQQVINKIARRPICSGDLIVDETTGDPINFTENQKGCLSLWCMLNGEGKPINNHKLVIGVDVAAGTGASNSCLAGYDKVTYEKVFEYVSPYCRPEALAVMAVGIAKWFREVSRESPFLIWELNGPGRQFGSRVLELGYGNIYLRRNDISITKKVSDIPGVAPTREAKLLFIGEYRDAVEGQKIINFSREALEETLEYIFNPDGSVSHARASNKTDPSGAKANHGDRVIADALAWKGIGSKRKIVLESPEPEIPMGSLAWRRQMREMDKKPKFQELCEGWV